MVKKMIASIFLLFVAFGFALASVLFGAGGIFPILVALSIVAVAVRMISQRGAASADDQFPA